MEIKCYVVLFSSVQENTSFFFFLIANLPNLWRYLLMQVVSIYIYFFVFIVCNWHVLLS